MDAIEPLWDDGEFVLSRKVPEDGRPSVLLTVPTLSQPRPGTIRRLEHAYALRDQLDPAWAARPLMLTQHQGRPLLLLEDPGGEPLARLLAHPMALTRFLRVAIGLTGALGRLHEQGFLHKDVRPANILVNTASGQVTLTGFGIASRLPRERQAPEPPEVIAGTLAYMAPEQTGRMNRSVDARSDLYALGVTLYEMLTGELPFAAADPMEWVHAHVARQPTPLIERVTVPEPLSAIVMKLLAKTPEERYQSAAGVEADLRRCLTELEGRGRVDPFPVATQDASDRLRNARYCDLRWGADGKVAQIERTHPHLDEAPEWLPSTTTIDATAGELDLGTVVKMSEAVSGEIVLDKLIHSLMVIAVEHAGAERGVLILQQGVEQRVEAEASTNADTVTVHLASGGATSAKLPESVLAYVMRTRDIVILGEAGADPLFGEDPYIRQRRARSILCLPLIKQTKPVGVLYLENDLTPHVFTPTRIALLKVLASQAAISLENARLFADLQRENLERKRAEGAVRTEQARVSGILEIADDAIISVDSGQRIALFNQGAEKVFGYAESEVIGQALDLLLPQRFTEAHRGHIEEFARSPDVARAMGQRREVFGRRKDGREFSAEASISKLDLDGEFVFTVILRDITDRKHAAEELQRSEAYFAQGQRLTRTGTWAQDLSTGELYWSQEVFCILGLDQAQRPLAMVDFLQHVHPEDRQLVEETVTRAGAKGRSFDHRFRIVRSNGEIIFVRSVGTPVSEGGVVRRYFGTIMDVTEHEQMTQEIRRREGELRQLIDFVPQHIIVLGPDGHRLHANKVTLEYTGHTLEEFRAADFDDVVHPDDRDRIRSEAQQIAGGVPFEMEGRMLGKDGRYRWFMMRYNPLRDEQGHIIRWYVAATEIEDRKRAEERVQKENLALREEIDRASMFEEIVGASAPLQAVLSRVTKVAPTESTVLITGETGTGKEIIARAIHKRSARSSRAFVSVNCAGIPQSLIASELFGHEKGAFTGAVQRRLGRFELAEGGTLFLDEVGELPAETQIALLRVLQEREFERIGGNRVVRADVRLIAATNRDLQAAVAAGSFRSDLFYRLNVFPLEMPPLRARKEDIPMLVEYFIARYAGKAGKTISGIDKKTLELLRSYSWPGNVRELQNVIERSVILCETETFSIDENWLSSQSLPPRPAISIPALNDRLASDQKALIEATLAEAKGRVSGPSGAAAKLGMAPSTLDSKIKSLKIDKHRFKHV